MLRYAVLMVALLFASPATAANEFQGQPLEKLAFMAKAHGATLQKLNEADTATMDAHTNPRPQPSEIYLLSLKTSVIIVLVHDGVVIVSTDPIESSVIDKMFGRTGA